MLHDRFDPSRFQLANGMHRGDGKNAFWSVTKPWCGFNRRLDYSEFYDGTPRGTPPDGGPRVPGEFVRSRDVGARL